MSVAETSFAHPLARNAKVWKAALKRGQPQSLLVIVTTLVLDATHSGFDARHVTRLSKAAEDYVQARADLDGYLLLNRVRDWA